ncbi:MAG: DUF3306 domain-containing protein [Rhodocyclaceae bacterium]|nr:DUF3306 domain-containing protein [Rhodocyclaceae bacterium]
MIERESAAAPESFLGRWSRRKQADRQGLVVPEPAEPPPIQEAVPAVVPEDDAPPRELTDADMPPIESLGEDSDFGAFLGSGVSEALRQKALQKLFGLPMCHVRDGLDDFDDDFTQFEALGDTVTYQMKQWSERLADAVDSEATPATHPAAPAPAADTPAADKGAPQRAETAADTDPGSAA